MLVDPWLNCWYERGGIPLSPLEMHDSIDRPAGIVLAFGPHGRGLEYWDVRAGKTDAMSHANARTPMPRTRRRDFSNIIMTSASSCGTIILSTHRPTRTCMWMDSWFRETRGAANGGGLSSSGRTTYPSPGHLLEHMESGRFSVAVERGRGNLARSLFWASRTCSKYGLRPSRPRLPGTGLR